MLKCDPNPDMEQKFAHYETAIGFSHAINV